MPPTLLSKSILKSRFTLPYMTSKPTPGQLAVNIVNIDIES